MTAPHETPQFQNSVEWTVAVTFRVEGGARRKTAYRRAQRIAERLADTASRAKGVVDVRARGGASHDGRLLFADPVRFAAANSGQGTYAEPGMLDRYLDPEFERALASLADANAAAQARARADEARRRAVGCPNRIGLSLGPPTSCSCVYCSPDQHLWAARGTRDASGAVPGLCVCGREMPGHQERCADHRAHRLVVLDGDPAELRRLADRQPPSRGDHPPGRRGSGPSLPGR